MAKLQSKSVKQYVTKKAVQNMLLANMEQKRYLANSNGTVATAGAIFYYSGIAQGDTLPTRTGDRIRPVTLAWKLGYADSLTGTARFIMVQDMMNTGSAPAVTDILSTAAVQSHFNPVNHAQNRFKILVDRTMETSVAGVQYINLGGTVKLRSPINYIGTGATSADGGKGSIYALIISGSAVGGYAIYVDLAYTDA